MGDCACDMSFLPSESDRPLFFFLELTPACNNHCSGCSNVFAEDRTPAPLSASEWKGIIDKLIPYVAWLKLTGGEPTLHPEFKKIVTYINGLGIPFTLLTNGRWLEPKQLITFLRGMTNFGGLLISLHGPDALSHEAFTRTPGSFAETVANIRKAAEAGLLVSTSTVITRYNWDKVDEIIHLAAELGADHAVFNRYIGKRLPAIEAAPAQEELALQRVGELISHRTGPLSVRLGTPIPHCFLPTDRNGCMAGEVFATVDPWANVRPCNHVPLTVGNLLEQSVEEVWYSEGMRRWREMISLQCRSCAEFYACHGGCRAQAILRGLKKDPLMRLAFGEETSEPLLKSLFPEEARLEKHFMVHPEPFGFVLVRGSHIIPIAPQIEPILKALDRVVTLHQIKERFGQEGLNFVGMLYTKGFVELREDHKRA